MSSTVVVDPQVVEVAPVQVGGEGEMEETEMKGRALVLSHTYVSRSPGRKALYPEL